MIRRNWKRKFDKHNLEEFCSSSYQQGPEKKNFIYARIASEENLEDLAKQVEYIKNANVNYKSYIVLTDISSGANLKRKGLTALIDSCLQGTIGEIVITHKDKLSRFAYDFIDQLVSKAGGSIKVIEDQRNKSSDQELSDDLLTIARAYCKKH